VRDAIVTSRLRAFTASDEFAELLLEEVDGSRMLNKRRRIVEAALEAHQRREYELSIPPLFAQVEGAVGDMMLVKDLVAKTGNTYHLPGSDGVPEKRPITLQPAVTKARLAEDLEAAAEFLSGVLVQRRNEVMHGRDVAYPKAKLSVHALLVLAVLARGLGELEEE
jgi:hypothetical protein